ncbi:Uncharacterised protein [Bordetella pertussis]|nr:Uncharacterised protein [Bordetella pertussis]CPP60312.1 Uncharacterised protein [Bordetella pertussis]
MCRGPASGARRRRSAGARRRYAPARRARRCAVRGCPDCRRRIRWQAGRPAAMAGRAPAPGRPAPAGWPGRAAPARRSCAVHAGDRPAGRCRSMRPAEAGGRAGRHSRAGWCPGAARAGRARPWPGSTARRAGAARCHSRPGRPAARSTIAPARWRAGPALRRWRAPARHRAARTPTGPAASPAPGSGSRRSRAAAGWWPTRSGSWRSRARSARWPAPRTRRPATGCG